MPLDEAQIVTIPANWQQFKQARSTARKFPLLTALFTESAAPLNESAPQKIELHEELQSATAEEKYDLLQTHIRQEVAGVLKLPLPRVDPGKPFGLMGLDSLMGLELRNRLENLLGLTLSATLVWNYPTIKEMAAYLAGKVGHTLTENTPAPIAEKTTVADTQLDDLMTDVAALSEDEALQALLNGN